LAPAGADEAAGVVPVAVAVAAVFDSVAEALEM
jgi:hypothetical protein